MRKFEDTTDYENWVETLAQNNLQRDGSPPEYVAHCSITTIVVFDDGATLSTNGIPYTEERATPSEVLAQTIHDATNTQIDGSFRQTAVNLLADDIAEAQREITAK